MDTNFHTKRTLKDFELSWLGQGLYAFLGSSHDSKYSAADLYQALLELQGHQAAVNAAYDKHSIESKAIAEELKKTHGTMVVVTLRGQPRIEIPKPKTQVITVRFSRAGEGAQGINQISDQMLEAIRTALAPYLHDLDWIALPVLEVKTKKLFKPNRNAVKFLESLKLTGEITKVRQGDPEATKGMNTPAVFFMLDINHVMRSKAVAGAFFGVAKGMLAKTDWNTEALKCLQIDSNWLTSEWIKYIDQGKANQQVLANFRRSDRSMRLVFEAKLVKGKQVINPIAVAVQGCPI